MMDPSWILLSWIRPFCTKLWLKLIQSDWNSFILTQIDDVSHLEFCLLLISHFEQKKTSLIHSHSTWWCQPSWILPSWIWPSWIQPFCTKLWLKLIQSDSNSFILTQRNDGSHLEFYHSCIQPFCTKIKLYSFILTHLDDGCHLEFCQVGFRHFA